MFSLNVCMLMSCSTKDSHNCAVFPGYFWAIPGLFQHPPATTAWSRQTVLNTKLFEQQNSLWNASLSGQSWKNEHLVYFFCSGDVFTDGSAMNHRIGFIRRSSMFPESFPDVPEPDWLNFPDRPSNINHPSTVFHRFGLFFDPRASVC